MDYSPLGFSVHGIFQARILEWVVIPFSRVSSWLRYRTWLFHILGRFFTIWVTREALLSTSRWKNDWTSSTWIFENNLCDSQTTAWTLWLLYRHTSSLLGFSIQFIFSMNKIVLSIKSRIKYINRSQCIEKQSPNFLAPESGFMEDSFSTSEGAGGVWWVWNDSNTSHLLCPLFLLLLLHQLHVISSGIISWDPWHRAS